MGERNSNRKPWFHVGGMKFLEELKILQILFSETTSNTL